MKRTLVLLLAFLMLGLFSGTALAANDDDQLPGQPEWKLKEKKPASVQKQLNRGKPVLQEKKAYQDQTDHQIKNPGQQIKTQQQLQEKLTAQLEFKAAFADSEQHWACQTISNMVAAGILTGYPDGTFKPDQPITQAEVIALAMRVADDDADDDSNGGEDEGLETVPQWAKNSVKKAVGHKIINLNRFHSQVQASRAQAVVWIAKAMGLEPVPMDDITFKDGILISPEDLGYIQAALKAGIISGMPDGNFNPNKAITRAQIASIIERILNENEAGIPGENAIPTRIIIPTRVTLEAGASQALTATVFYSDGTHNNEVIWSSSDSDLVSVSPSGLLKASSDMTGQATITASAVKKGVEIEATCQVIVVERNESAADLTATGHIGVHNGQVYEEFVLEVDNQSISLAEDEAERITLTCDGGAPVVLVPNSDTTLWFNVQKASGEYVLKVENKDGFLYTATLDWTAPREVEAVLTGEEGQHNGNDYVEYRLGSLDLSDFTEMYQIKPDDSVAELNSNRDANLWFKVNDQQEGTHTFLIKQNDRWYVSCVHHSVDQ